MIQITNHNTVCLIVTYFPDDNLLLLVREIKIQSLSFIIVDNSNYENEIILKLKNDYPNEKYLSNYNFNGISRAYNLGFNLAIKLDYEFVITIDQDSLIGKKLISTFNQFFKLIYFDNNKFGAVGVNFNKKFNNVLTIIKTHELINSGTLISTKAFLFNKGYNERYFIDNVDFDFFIRLHLSNYSTYKISNYSIKHKLGESFLFNKFFFKFSINKYSTERLYFYSYSNILFFKSFILKKPFFCLKKIIHFKIYLIKSILIYNKKELNSILKGMRKAIKTNIYE